MTFQRYRGRRQLIGYLMRMGAMRAALTTGGVYLISMENIKVGLKDDESGKGAIMKPPLKKSKPCFWCGERLFWKLEERNGPYPGNYAKLEAFICPDNRILQRRINFRFRLQSSPTATP